MTAFHWIVAADIEDRITLASGDVLDRGDFHACLWETADRLVGIDEGSVTVADAAARGLVPTDRVIDAAAAPLDRDWVARLAVAREAWWFADEATARAAAAVVRAVSGCRILGIRADVPIDHEAATPWLPALRRSITARDPGAGSRTTPHTPHRRFAPGRDGAAQTARPLRPSGHLPFGTRGAGVHAGLPMTTRWRVVPRVRPSAMRAPSGPRRGFRERPPRHEDPPRACRAAPRAGTGATGARSRGRARAVALP